MNILGVGGGPYLVHEPSVNLPHGWAHDASAVLLREGQVVAALEDERLNRIKHSNKFPASAIRGCLQVGGIRIQDVDAVAYCMEEAFLDAFLRRAFLSGSIPMQLDGRQMVQLLMMRSFGHAFEADRIRFVSHHRAHAASAWVDSGFETGLIVTWDGRGEDDSGLVARGAGATMAVLESFPAEGQSLGWFYQGTIRYLGFNLFDEYKVMGLAPYGDPSRYRALVAELFTLRPEGQWAINFDNFTRLFEIGPPRRGEEPLTKSHQDLAASIQEGLETIAFHVLQHWQRKTGERSLCLAGGVAMNCTLNGKILRSGMFDEVFVQPVSHDGGCALGAAQAVQLELSPEAQRPRRTHLFLGLPLGEPSDVLAEASRWEAFVDISVPEDVCQRAADLLAAGKVIGWCQGRSEFGPRALGARSILADPRPAANKEIINGMVKKREGFRPFAPAVLAEEASRFFDIPRHVDMPFMIFVVPVREEMRELLGAVTHVDGSARVQTVTRSTNERYWRVIHAFGERTGCPILLNTSFNNNAEPIVDSVDDAIVCFLTTKLDALVLGDIVLHKRDVDAGAISGLVPSLPRYLSLERVRRATEGAGSEVSWFIRHNARGGADVPVSSSMFELLDLVDGVATVGELAAKCGGATWGETLRGELMDLWAKRMVILLPRASAGRTASGGLG